MTTAPYPTMYDGRPIIPDNNSNRPASIRPCADQYAGKTFAGIYLGEVEAGLPCLIPAIWVPEINQTILGCESWWGFEGPGTPKTITPEVIQTGMENALKHSLKQFDAKLQVGLRAHLIEATTKYAIQNPDFAARLPKERLKLDVFYDTITAQVLTKLKAAEEIDFKTILKTAINDFQ